MSSVGYTFKVIRRIKLLITHWILKAKTKQNNTNLLQGELGDCWLLAAMSSLAMDTSMLYKVLPRDQSFSEDYAGIFKFR